MKIVLTHFILEKMYKSYFYTTKLNFKKFFSILPNKKNIILDYGCGNGIFQKIHLKNKKIKLIKMVDKNKKLKKFIINKYQGIRGMDWVENLNEKYDIVFMNSVIQYIDQNEYKKIIKFFIGKKIKLILISDIPKYPRFLEGIFLFFINPFKLFKGIQYIFQRDYIKNGFFFKKLDELIVPNNNYEYKIEKNLNDDIFLRYSLIIKKR